MRVPSGDHAGLLENSSGPKCVSVEALPSGPLEERLRAGETPSQIRAYFVEKYGLWILLAPPRQGFNLLVWVAPFAALLSGLVVVAFVLRRWTRRPPPAVAAAPPIDDAMRERIRRELGG